MTSLSSTGQERSCSSRRVVETAKPRSREEIDLDVMVSMVQFSNNKILELRRETDTDTILRDLQEVIIRGWPKTRADIPIILRPFWCYRDELGRGRSHPERRACSYTTKYAGGRDPAHTRRSSRHREMQDAGEN